jgi:hypothetical protein
MPVARQSARAPAMFLPWVVVLERYSGITDLCLGYNIGLILAEIHSPNAKTDADKNSGP